MSSKVTHKQSPTTVVLPKLSLYSYISHGIIMEGLKNSEIKNNIPNFRKGNSKDELFVKTLFIYLEKCFLRTGTISLLRFS